MSVKATIYYWKELALLSYLLSEKKEDAYTFIYNLIDNCIKDKNDKIFITKKDQLDKLQKKLSDYKNKYTYENILEIFYEFIEEQTDYKKDIFIITGNIEQSKVEELDIKIFLEEKNKLINFPVNIVYTSTGNLQKDKSDNVFTKLHNYFETLKKAEKEKKEKDENYQMKFVYTPVIIISTENLINISDPESDNFENFQKLNIDRRFKFIDGSIWNYYLPINNEFDTNFSNISAKIEANYKNELYKTAFAKEFIELQYRLVVNSYLTDAEAHSTFISPFVFHSESKLKKMADEKFKELITRLEGYQQKITWNVLFVDDYSEIALRGVSNNKYTKTCLVNNILKDDKSIREKENENYPFEIKFQTTPQRNVLNFTKKKIIEGQKSEKDKIVYDIIFLDYLLGEKDDNKREYGYEFFSEYNESYVILNEDIENELFKCGIPKDIIENLKELDNKNFEQPWSSNDYSKLEKELKKILDKYYDKFKDIVIRLIDNTLSSYKCPFGKFWIFPITVFTNALLDRLREQGISRLDDDWFIADGADPVNTPELFRYNFYNLLEQQISDAIFTKNDIIKFLIQNNLIENKTETKDEELRLWAKQFFGAFIHKFGKREILETDSIKGSEFASSILKYLHDTQKGDYRFYDHIRQLLYLLAYGTGFNATQMWELLNFIDYELFVISGCKNENLKETFRDLIPKYITNLSQLNS
jgi:hypothetical protein